MIVNPSWNGPAASESKLSGKQENPVGLAPLDPVDVSMKTLFQI